LIEERAMREITVVGGGLAGLVASIECVERGLAVQLVEAHRELGGRGRSTDGPYRANLGPHALYSDGPAWAWLRQRDLLPPVARPSAGGLRFRQGGRIRRLPPLGLIRALAQRRVRAPVDADLRSWAGSRWGSDVASMLAGAAGVFTFDHDPGRLSAAFVWPRLLRVSALPPAARYAIGGGQALIERLEQRARALGIRIETGTRASTLPDPPVIVATELPDAARLLGEDELHWESGRALCLDIGLERRRGDVFIVADLDEGAWIERFTASDPTLAPDEHELLQAQIGIRPGENLVTATARLEQLLDMTFADWRSRETWRRRQVMDARTGALDLPGTSWRDRPAIERGAGAFLAGDMVAADGLLSEVSFASGQRAADHAATWSRAADHQALRR
jgi:hypothetical protein